MCLSRLSLLKESIVLLSMLGFYYESLIAAMQLNRVEYIFLDENDPHARRFTRQYRRKLQVVKVLWLTTGSLIAVCPFPALVILLLMLATFLSFSILDETA